MTDRRRINGPPSGTLPPVFAVQTNPSQCPTRTRRPNQLRKIFLRTGLTPSASGSAYLELQQPPPTTSKQPATTSLIPPTSSLKITCTVHGPKPLPRSAPFSPQLVLSTHVKFAPFAARAYRRGYIRDALERDLGVHLETALRGVVLGDRWPKSGVDVVVTVLEAEDDAWWGAGAAPASGTGIGGAGAMTVLAGCITVASAAILEAGIDCVDVVVGGVTAAVDGPEDGDKAAAAARDPPGREVVLDPCPSEHNGIAAACVVAYLAARDELTQVWIKGDVGSSPDYLIDRAVEAAVGARKVLTAVLKESAEAKGMLMAGNGSKDDTTEDIKTGDGPPVAAKKPSRVEDVEMSG